jgi:hypothetical protein
LCGGIHSSLYKTFLPKFYLPPSFGSNFQVLCLALKV